MAASGNTALTEIRHGAEDGTVTVFAEGDKVTGLSKEEMESLRESGAIGSPEPEAEEEAEKPATTK